MPIIREGLTEMTEPIGGVLEEYRSIARQVSHCIMRDVLGDIDALAMGRDDYEHELVTHAWVCLLDWRTGSRAAHGPQAEHRYVCKCIWNRAKSFVRSRLRAHRRAHMVMLTEARGGLDESFEERAIVRQTLRMLRARLRPKDWRVLCQIAVAEGDCTRGGTRSTQRARAHAKKRAIVVSQFLECGVRQSDGINPANAGTRGDRSGYPLDARCV